MRVSKFPVKCLGCGAELTVYPRHILHHEPLPCPKCGRRNSPDEYDLKDAVVADSRDLAALLKKKP